eukprot:IDg1861t1
MAVFTIAASRCNVGILKNRPAGFCCVVRGHVYVLRNVFILQRFWDYARLMEGLQCTLSAILIEERVNFTVRRLPDGGISACSGTAAARTHE